MIRNVLLHLLTKPCIIPILIIGVAVLLFGCVGKPKIAVQEFCAVSKELMYSSGPLKFTKEEVQALSEENKNKLVAFKVYYKNNCQK